ncbi:MAG: diheme cytochrome c-553 [Chitinophagaceae bacterium]
MKKIIFTGLIFGLVIYMVSCKEHDSAGIVTAISNDSLLKRGDYLVMAMGCDDCHSPKKMGPNGPEIDFERRFAGSPAGEQLPPRPANAGRDGWVLFSMDQTVAIGPWGTSYAANISSDSTGVGAWSELNFATAMRKGKFKGLEGARTLVPPMPWQNYRDMSDEDIRAIYLFLKNSKPVKNIVPAYEPPSAPPVTAK